MELLLTSPPLLLFGLSGPLEIGIILVVVLLLFGTRIPHVARSLGQGIVEFRKGLKEPSDETEDEETEDSRKVEARETS